MKLNHKEIHIQFEYKITLCYILFGCIWILLSDKLLLLLINDLNKVSELQTYKGWFFIFCTGSLLYYFAAKHMKRLRITEILLEKKGNQILDQYILLQKRNKDLIHKNEQMGKLNSKLIIAKGKAEMGEKFKMAFIYNMSHEIRTPLNAILGFSSLIANGNITVSQKAKYRKIIEEEGNRLLELINNTIEISNIETKSVKINKTDNFDIREVIVNAYKRFEKSVNSNVKLKRKILIPNHAANIINDKVKIQQIMYNLITNAIKFTQHGEIEIGCRLNYSSSCIELYVRDSGIGIPHEELDNIFKSFYKLNEMTKGGGLGLAISKSFARLIGAKIIVKSELNRGSEFIIVLDKVCYNCVHRAIQNRFVSSIVSKSMNTNQKVLIHGCYFNINSVIKQLSNYNITSYCFRNQLENQILRKIHNIDYTLISDKLTGNRKVIYHDTKRSSKSSFMHYKKNINEYKVIKMIERERYSYKNKIKRKSKRNN